MRGECTVMEMLREKPLLTTWGVGVSFASVNIEVKEIKIPSPSPIQALPWQKLDIVVHHEKPILWILTSFWFKSCSKYTNTRRIIPTSYLLVSPCAYKLYNSEVDSYVSSVAHLIEILILQPSWFKNKKSLLTSI